MRRTFVLLFFSLCFFYVDAAPKRLELSCQSVDAQKEFSRMHKSEGNVVVTTKPPEDKPDRRFLKMDKVCFGSYYSDANGSFHRSPDLPRVKR